MSDTSTAAVTEQQDAVKANWDALKNWEQPAAEQPAPTPESVQNKDVVKADQVKDEVAEPAKPETPDNQEKKEEPKSDTPEAKKDEKADEPPKEDAPLLELKPEDIKDVPTEYEEGDWRGVGVDLSLNVKENTFEAFQEAIKEQYVPKADYEKALKLSEKEVFAKLSPEAATAMELLNLGVPQELIFEPTKQIDGYLALDDSALVREDLKAQGYAEDLVDAKMEEMVEASKVETAAKILRFELGKQKNTILQQRQQIVEQRKAEIEQVQKQSKEKEITQIKEALNNTSEFIGVSLSKEAKEAIAKKLQAGAYDKELSTAQLKVNAILHKEFGQRFTEHMKNKFLNEGKMAEVKKLANVPPVIAPAAGVEKATTQTDNWGALKGLV
jgi:hypothetical protein